MLTRTQGYPMKDNDWINADLQDWATWVANQSGYSSTTVLSRAMAGQLDFATGFRSVVPKGAFDSDRPHIRHVNFAMAELFPEHGEVIDVVKAHYLLGPKRGREKLGIPARTFRHYRKRGVSLIKAFIEGEARRVRAAK